MTQNVSDPGAPLAVEPNAALPRAAFGSGPLSGFFLLAFMGASWGLTIPLSKLAVAAGAHPLGLTFWQGAIGGGFLLFLCLLRRRLPRFGRQHLLFYIVCGILGSVLPGSLLFWVAAYLPAGVIAIAIACVPLVTYALAVSFRIEAPAIRRMGGVGLGLAAVAMIALPKTSLPDPGLAIWVVVTVVACAAYAFENIYIALRQPPGLDALAATAGLLLMAALLMVPLVLANDAWVPLHWPPQTLDWTIVAMALASAIAYSLYVYVVAVAGPIFASQAAYLVTVGGVLWGMALLGERHSAWIWGALLAMLLGLSLVQPRRRPRG